MLAEAPVHIKSDVVTRDELEVAISQALKKVGSAPESASKKSNKTTFSDDED